MSYSGAVPSPYVSTAQPALNYGTATPPAPPPKQSSGPGTPSRGPPLPPPPPSGQSHQRSSSLYQSQDAVYQPQFDPPQAGWLPEGMTDKSTPDLHKLLEDPDMQTALLSNPRSSHPTIQASETPLKQLLESNIALATSVEQLEERLAAQRSATQSRLLSLRALEQQHRSKIKETEDKLHGFSPMALYQRLNASVQEQDAFVKGIEESFLEHGGIASDRETSDFIRRVRDAKRLAFLRTERKERWDEGRVGGWR